MPEFLLEQLGENVPFWIGCAVLLLPPLFMAAVRQLREKLAPLFSCGRGRFAAILTYLLAVGAVVVLLFVPKFPPWVSVTVYASIAGAIALLWYLTLCCTPAVLLYTFRIGRKIRAGYLGELKDKMARRPRFALTPKDKLACELLGYRYYALSSYNRKAYECLAKIDPAGLFPWEREKLFSCKAFVLKALGANGTAKELYSRVKHLRPTDRGILALIDEEAGRFDEAEAALKQLYDASLAESGKEQNVVANNLGRMYVMRGNYVAGAEHYRSALAHAIKERDIYGIETARDNLICTLVNTDMAEAKKVYEEHLAWLSSLPPTIWRKVSMANTKLKFAECTKDPAAIRAVIREVEAESGSFPTEPRIHILISTALILCRFHFDLRTTLQQIEALFPVILQFPMPERYTSVCRIAEVLSQIKADYPPFQGLFHAVDGYFCDRAEEDLSKHIKSLPDYAVYERCHLLKERAFLQNRKIANFLRYRDAALQIGDLYASNGLNFGNVETLLSAAMDAYTYPPYLAGMREGFPVSRYETEAKEIVARAEAAAAPFRRYPQMAEADLQFAFLHTCFGDYEAAREYVELFEATDLPLLCLTYPLRERYALIKRTLERHG